MTIPAPHFLLYAESHAGPASGSADSTTPAGHWRFVLESADGDDRIEAADEEQAAHDRLELLAVVRGLESLDQPSRVTIVTRNRYVARGLQFGLDQWRESDWQWERFGQMSPIKDRDLWQRVDRATQFHEIECRTPRLEAHDDLNEFVPSSVFVPVAADDEFTAVEHEPSAPVAIRSRGRRRLIATAAANAATKTSLTATPASTTATPTRTRRSRGRMLRFDPGSAPTSRSAARTSRQPAAASPTIWSRLATPWRTLTSWLTPRPASEQDEP